MSACQPASCQHLLFDHIQFNRIDDAAFVPEPLERALDFGSLAGELDVDPSGRLPNVCPTHIGHDVKF